MKRFLKSGSFLLLFIASCMAPYKGLKEQSASSSVFEYKPHFQRVLYRCIVDGRFIFKKFHLSGLLFFKELENGTKRAVFQNEMGVAFFDMQWDKDGNFQLKQIMPQLDKEAVVKTLRKDLEMLMMIGFDKKTEKMFSVNGGNGQLYRLNRDKGFVYYSVEGQRLSKIENTDNRKAIVSVNISGKHSNATMPDTVNYIHHKANFTISLTKIERNVNE